MMLKLQGRSSMAAAALTLILISSTPAAAQFRAPRERGGLLNNLVTGAAFEIMDQAKAERRLQRLEARFDPAVGNAAVEDHNIRKIDRTRFRIRVDEWLIRYNTCQELTPYPNPLCLDPQTRAAIGQYRYPAFGPPPPP
jgi:hypothetical protein